MFFALSGFLIAGSAMRLSLWNFIVNRGLRIVPALAVEIVLSALILGPIFTTLPLSDYFSNLQTYHYFTNIVGLINFRLPGVFDNHPVYQVNESLWTVPYEIGCYAIMSGLIVCGLLRRPWTVLALGAVVLSVGLVLVASGYTGLPQSNLQRIVDHLFYSRGSRLFVAFCLGIAAFLYRYKLPYSRTWFWVAVGSLLIVAGFGDSYLYPNPVVELLTGVPAVYVTVFLGVSRLPRLPLFRRGDYSYGIYLYGWPLTQAMFGWFPGAGANAFVLFGMTAIPITLFAMFSWHAIEKPILRLRKKFSFVARQRLAEAAPDPKLAGGEQSRPITGPSTSLKQG